MAIDAPIGHSAEKRNESPIVFPTSGQELNAMADVLIDIFPLDVVGNIFLFMTKKALRTLCDGLSNDSVLRQHAISEIYKHMRVTTLDQLVEAANDNAHVGTMQLRYTDEFLSFFKGNPTFTSNISNVDILALLPCDYTLVKEIPFQSISRVCLYGLKSFEPSSVPQNVKLLDLNFLFDQSSEKIKEWPPSLTSLNIQGHNDVGLIELPQGLRELSCQVLKGLWELYPPKLAKLELSRLKLFPNLILFPKSLHELEISACQGLDVERIVANLPPKLKKLCLAYTFGGLASDLEFPDSIEVLELRSCKIESLEVLKFPKSLIKLKLNGNRIKKLENLPQSLKVLHVPGCPITSFNDCEFPSLLRELYAYGILLTSLDGVTFPDLEILDIEITPKNAGQCIKSLKNAKFPNTLLSLRAYGHHVGDYLETKFPQGLLELEISVKGKPQNISFPPELELLKLILSNGRTSQLSQLNLPATLQELHIENGKCSEFDWNLPDLQNLTLINIKGRVNVPSSVSKLIIRVGVAQWLEGMTISREMDDCQITCRHGNFNEEVTKLIECYTVERMTPTLNLREFKRRRIS
ncbi:CIC11C00000002188 [Sungouiella intermedia]|uniref:CIC11C00000002188 n=1 Tax=Sungouiella intermedia TaxID=45354 RepID=A0A1L0BAZ5_9ASCO|nr:CIC11C00000002188 [[Candida] intermedia]